jgi:hypothetical protein
MFAGWEPWRIVVVAALLAILIVRMVLRIRGMRSRK